MRNLIKKILKEEEDDGFNWADKAVNTPRDILGDAYDRFKWDIYIPILGKKISFYLNPEHWNLMATIRVQNVERRGHGPFGDDPHKDYQPSVLNNLKGERERTYYSKENIVGDSGGERVYVDIEQVIDDIEGYSTEAKQYTEEYQQQVEELTRQYMEKMSGLSDKYNFNDSYGAEAVVVQDGQIKKEDDFPNSRYNRWK
jgi:hypothetical protein